MPAGDVGPSGYVHADGRRRFPGPPEGAAGFLATRRFRIRRHGDRGYPAKARGKMPDEAADAARAAVDCVASVGIDGMPEPMGRCGKRDTKGGGYRWMSKWS